jgi:DNA repair exonuclease SbcCD ATPase subunit
MPDIITDDTTPDTLSDQDSDQSVEEGAEEKSQEKNPYEGMDEAKLLDALKERDKELSKANDQAKNLQSLHDRHYNEAAKERAKLAAKLELLESQQARGVSPEQSKAEQDEFDQKWRTEIGEDPTKSIDFVRGVMGDVVATLRSDIENFRKEMKGEMSTRDSYYREHQEAIDAMAKELGVDIDRALSFHQKHMKQEKKGVAQPGKVDPPGQTAEGTRRSASPTPTEPVQIDAMSAEVMRMAGVTEEEAQKIAKDIASDIKETQ